ncbi:MAG: hypothetical protein GF418_16770, partial [Chitinivibrionales bacterium]|nr:hypothetical protein [Chitinivibrionales bacterium]MBD3397275.1 hypothetical protein [Chitinivibrionales bacterium]
AARALLLWRKNRYSAAVSVGSLVLERIIDILVFMLFFAMPILALPRLAKLAHLAWATVVFVALSAAALALCARHPGLILRLVDLLRHVTPKKFHHRISAIGTDLASVLDWTYSPRAVFAVLTLSLLVPLCYALSLMLLVGNFAAFGIYQGAFVTSFAVMGAAIPLAPGYVGTLHATVLQGYLLLGFDHHVGRAMAVLVHAVGYVPVTLVGFIYFLKADMSFREISHAKEALEE